MPQIIAFTNQKGGVGKTTTASAVLTGLTAKGKKVLGIDLDPQGSLGFSLGVNIEESITLYEVFKKQATINNAITSTVYGDIIPSNILLSSAELDFNQPGREYLLKNALAPIVNRYDYIIIDTPPALNILTVNAYTFANSLIIPMIPDILSLLGISQLKDTIETVIKDYNKDLKIMGILLTKYNSRTKLAREVKEMSKEIAKQLNTIVIDIHIRNSVAAAEAPAHAESLLEYAPKSNAALDYSLLVEKIVKKKI